jgi:hypothetical protein
MRGYTLLAKRGASLIGCINRPFVSLLFALSLLATVPAPAGADPISAEYLYNLSDFNGAVPYNYARLYVDNLYTEVYVINGTRLDVFNRTGMEIYDFFLDYGAVYGMAVEPGGDIVALVHIGGENALVHCNYRGEPLSDSRLTSLPPELASAGFTAMKVRNGLFYFADLQGLKVVVTDSAGVFVRGYDFGVLLASGMSAKEFKDLSFGGFDVDDAGEMFFTLPITGEALKVAVDGTLTGIGRRGSGPGKFGVPSAIALDRRGNVFVCDKLKSTVLVFDKTTYAFVTEFGYRGLFPGNLVVPISIAVGDDGRVYVSQLMKRGVNVYKLTYQ